ncbi:ATP-grasp fold domain containing protein [Penicillium fimorum]|uniref:ATP-grasp fold domain containing protein n=1 Tax=Penicillium fimorum TaxID=1882269 RepID=A0A9X0C3C0_9EURO|nr:ATP-grasp fold domain containing protein [Penicillium fimorum]
MSLNAGSLQWEIDASGKRGLVECHWKLNPPPNDTAPYRTLDLTLIPISIWPHDVSPLNGYEEINGPVLRDTGNSMIEDAILQNIEAYGTSITAAKLILPRVSGYIVRNDFFRRRFLTCSLAEKAVDSVLLRQLIPAFDFSAKELLPQAMKDAPGVILLKSLPGFSQSLVQSALATLECEVEARLDFPWIVETPLPRKRIAMVYGRPNPAVSTTSQGIYRAVQALGVDLVVLDHAGHWVQDSAMEAMRDEFIPCDLTMNEGLVDRIVAALSTSKGRVDGITTYTDTHLLATAQVAKKMGLPANPPEALEICRDKYKTRLVASSGVQVLSITTTSDLDEQLGNLSSPLEFPLIVKPTTGCCSDGVSKVTCEAELRNAVQRNLDKFPGTNTLVEPYISGPEVDANFVFLDGNLIWSEINDDFPSSAEISSSVSSSMSFAELSTIMPSILPQSEIHLLKSSLTETLLKMGFRNGVYHLEARVRNSKKKYINTARGMELSDYAIELPTCDPSVFLIEINPRLPGHQESFAVEYTYGIDYFALQLLLATALPASEMGTDSGKAFKDAIVTLSHPLSEPAQHPSHVVFIPADHGGIFQGAEPLPDGIMSYVPEHGVFMQVGEVIPDPEVVGKWPFVAFFLVVGKIADSGMQGREQVRAMGDLLRKTFRYELV